MKKSEIVKPLALAAAFAVAPALLTSPVWAEPAASPSAAQQKAPSMNDAGDDLAAPSGAQTNKAAPADATTAASAKEVAVGATVFGSDGKKIGQIKGVKAEPSGAVQEIHITTGGLFGVGAKTVVVPGSKIAKGGQTIQLAMTSEEVGKLPALGDKSG